MRLSRTLIVISVALALNLVGVGTAQAYEWTIEGEPLPSLGLGSETTSSSGGAFELAVPNLKLTIKCTAQSGTGEVSGEAKGSASLSFSGCVVSGAEKACTVKSPGKSTGVLAATAATKFLRKGFESGEKFYDEVALFMVVEITGKECVFPEKTEVFGTTAREVPKMGEEVTKRTGKFSKAIAEESGVSGLSFGKNAAYLTGESTEQLNGGHTGAPIGVNAVTVLPVPVAFTGPTTTKKVKIFNTSTVTIKLTEFGLTGPYGLADPNGCLNSQVPTTPFANFCEVTLTCNQAQPGTFFVKWQVVPPGGATGKVTVAMTC